MQEKYKIFFSLLVEKLKHMNNMTSKLFFPKFERAIENSLPCAMF